MPRLFVTKGKRLLAIHRIDGTLMIGRGEGADVRLDDSRASRSHAVIASRDGVLTLRDLNSKNGTDLNGEPVLGEVALKLGDEIRIGQSFLYVGEPPVAIKKKYLATSPPKRVGKFTVLHDLGRGGMGEVYKAFDTENEVIVALKIVRKALADSEDFLKRFHDREARLVRQLSHPNIVETYEDGVAEGHHYMSMEYVEGGSLADLVKAGRVPVGETLEIIKQAARGLQAAHEQGIVHRDIKPSNILLQEVTPARAAPQPRPQPITTEFEISNGQGAGEGPELPEGPLVGRGIEIERIAAALTAARRGRENLLLVRGEAGMGKTRLVSEFAGSSHAEGYLLLAAAADGAATSYSPFRQIAEELLRRLDHRRDEFPAHTLDRWVSLLSSVLSDATLQRYGRRAIVSADPREMAEAVCDLLAILQPESRFIVFLDDLQWADEISCRLLEYLVRAAAAEKFLILGALREDPRRINSPLQATLANLGRAGLLSEMFLKPLTRFEIVERAAGLLGDRDLARSLAETLYRVSKGSPGTARRALASLLASGTLIRTASGYELRQEQVSDLSADLSQILIDRFRALPGPVQEIFKACCVAGHSFNFAVLQPVVHQEDSRLFFALSHLVSEGLLVAEQRGSDKFYRVASEQLRKHVLAGLDERQRVPLYSAVAAVVERIFTEPSVELFAQLADLYSHGNNYGKAARYLIMAAERAKSTETASAAKAHLDNALVLLRSARADADRLRRVEAELRAVYGQQDNYEQYIQRQVSVLNPSYVKIADFGVALMAMDTANGGERTAGTPRYMAPEQIQGKALDGRCDIFSLGVVAFEMLTGRVTFEVEHKTEYLRLNCNEDIAPITAVDPSLPQEVGRIVQQMTARDREARYSAADLIADIEAAQMATTALA